MSEKYMAERVAKYNSFGVFRTMILFILTLLFTILTYYVISDTDLYWDRYISNRLQSERYLSFNSLMRGLSYFGNVPFAFSAIVITSLIFYLFKKKREAFLMLSTMLTGIISWILKTMIDRPRPTADLVQIFEETKYQSFPSGHVLFYTVFFGFLSIICFHAQRISIPIKRTLIVCLIIILFLSAASRIYLGAHWFTDILGGFIIGIQFLIIGEFLYARKSDE